MGNSTKALMLKADGTVVEGTFFADNAEALNAVVTGGGGGGGGAVASVNGHTGTVVLAAADVGAPTTANLTDGLALKASATRNITTANSLQGGGDLTGDRTLQLVGDENAPAAKKVYGTAADGTRGWQTLADILPGYVDDVIEAANFAALPGTGETGKIYVTLDTNLTWRWSGSAYVIISSSPAMADQSEAEAGTDNATTMTPLRAAQAIAAQAAPKARTVSAAGLATGGGDLSANRTITVPIASQAQAEAGSDNATAMTPLRTAEAVAALAGSPVFVGHGTLKGYTDSGHADVPATTGFLTFVPHGTASDGSRITFTVDGVSHVMGWNGNSDNSGMEGGYEDDGASIANSINLLFPGVAAWDGTQVVLTAPGPGTGHSVGITFSQSWDFDGPILTPGTDDIPYVAPSGAIASVELIPAKSGKNLVPVAFLARAFTGLAGCVVTIRRGTVNLFSLDMSANSATYDLLTSPAAIADLVSANPGQSLNAIIDGTIPNAGQVDIMIAALAV